MLAIAGEVGAPWGKWAGRYKRDAENWPRCPVGRRDATTSKWVCVVVKAAIQRATSGGMPNAPNMPRTRPLPMLGKKSFKSIRRQQAWPTCPAVKLTGLRLRQNPWAAWCNGMRFKKSCRMIRWTVLSCCLGDSIKRSGPLRFLIHLQT